MEPGWMVEIATGNNLARCYIHFNEEFIYYIILTTEDLGVAIGT